MRVWQILADRSSRVDESDAIAVVLMHAGRDGKDVRIEDDVLGRETDLIDQYVVGALADRGLAFERVGLPFFVKRHHHHSGSVTAHGAGMIDEGLLALLERNRIDHRLPLQAFQTCLDHRKFRRIDHHRDARDVRFRGNQVEKRGHGLLGIEQALVHIDVDHLGAVLDLLARDRKTGGIVACRDQFAKFSGAGDVGALSDIDEGNLRRERE